MKGYIVDSIPKEQTYEWLLKKHYAHRIPSISYAFGIYDSSMKLCGVCTFGSPPSHHLCIGICGIEFSDIVLELNRLVLNKTHKNQASFFISKCLKKIPPPRVIVSYADTQYNHHGYVYQATNWIYTGLSAKRTERYDPNNPNKHSKSVTESKVIPYKELSIRDRSRKHRYVYIIGSKKMKKILFANLKYKPKPYPKGENQEYDANYEPNIQGVLPF